MDEPKKYFLLRVPKKIDISSLNKIKINLSEDGARNKVKHCNVSYTVSPCNDQSIFHRTTLLVKDKENEDSLEPLPEQTLQSCITFYQSEPTEWMEPDPIQSRCPNDSIADIVTRRKYPGVLDKFSKNESLNNSLIKHKIKKERKSKNRSKVYWQIY